MNETKILYVGARVFVLEYIIKSGLDFKALILKDTIAANELRSKGIGFNEFCTKAELLDQIENSDFDLLVSCGCPFILPVSKIKKPNQIFINLHPSLLPNLKGKSPINGSLLFDIPPGATCHIMDDGIDSGEIISQAQVDCDENISLGLLYRLVFRAEVEAFALALKRNFKPNLDLDLENVKVDYYSRQENDNFIDLSLANSQILKTIRAFSTLTQQSFLKHKNKIYKIYSAKIIKNNFLNVIYNKSKNLEIIFKYDDKILIKKDGEFLELQSLENGFSDLKEGEILDSLDFKNDVYFYKDYARLYAKKDEEIFEFKFQEGDKILHNLAIKSRIKNSDYYDLQSVYGYGGLHTNTNDENFIKNAFLQMKKVCKEQNIIAQFFRFHPFNQNIKEVSEHLNFISKNRKVVCVDTSLNPQKRRQNYSSRMKSIISKAKRELEISRCINESEFQEIYYESMNKNSADDFYFFDLNYFKNIFNFSDFMAYKATFKNQICSVASFFFGKNFGYYHLSGTKTEILSKNLNANAALLDFFFDIAYEKNIKYCILGGGMSDDDSLLQYKQKFSKNTVDFYIGGVVYDQEIYDYFVQLYGKQDVKIFLKYRG